MKTERHFPKNFAAMQSLVHSAAGPAGCLVFQAGHFLLIHDEETGALLPCIEGQEAGGKAEAIISHYGCFPVLTFELALRLIRGLPATQAHLMVVVNDWQYVPGHCNREDFYTNWHGRLPEAYREALEVDPIGNAVQLLEPEPLREGISTAPFFGEMNLRNRYQRRISKLVATGKLPSTALVEKTEKTTICKMPDPSGAMQEIYCSGKTGDCSGEIAEMLREGRVRTGASVFINLYPAVCRDFVESGTWRAKELFGVDFATVINLGFPSSGIMDCEGMIEGCECTIHRFD
jgi:hypothetical protein